MNKTKIASFDLISYLFIMLFVYAAVSKLLDYQNFTTQLNKSPMLARYGSFYWIIPAVEITISLFLAVPQLRMVGLYASFSLMTMFSAYIVAILKYSEYIPCSCGGVLQHMSWSSHLCFNIVFIALGCSAILLTPKHGLKN